MSVELNDKEKFIVSNMFKENAYMEDVEFVRNRLSGDYISRVGHSKMPIEGGPEVNMYFSTGLLSDNVYVMVSDGDKLEISNLISNLEFGDFHGIASEFGRVIKLEDNRYLKENGCFGLVMLRVNTIPFLPNCKDGISFNKVNINLLLPTFISKKEYENVKKNGLDSLLGQFSKSGKNIYSINQ